MRKIKGKRSTNHGFDFLGGACGRGIYDNMTTPVSKVLRGKLRELNPRFEELCAHYVNRHGIMTGLRTKII